MERKSSSPTFKTTSVALYANNSAPKKQSLISIAKYGQLDIMFNNARIGSMSYEKFVDEADNLDFKKVFDTNVFGLFYGAKYAAKAMISARKGCIIFTSSVVASTSMVDIGHAYVVSKHAIVGLTKSLYVDLGQFGIRVNCISPFVVATPAFTKAFGDMKKKETEEMISASANLKGTVLEANDVAEAALYLVCDESKYVSGLNLVVNGGYSTTNTSFTIAIKYLFNQAV